jgi:hypothetical protein
LDLAAFLDDYEVVFPKRFPLVREECEADALRISVECHLPRTAASPQPESHCGITKMAKTPNPSKE